MEYYKVYFFVCGFGLAYFVSDVFRLVKDKHAFHRLPYPHPSVDAVLCVLGVVVFVVNLWRIIQILQGDLSGGLRVFWLPEQIVIGFYLGRKSGYVERMALHKIIRSIFM